jgi:hypothetical protein
MTGSVLLPLLSKNCNKVVAVAEYRKTLGDKLAHFFGDASMPCRLNTAETLSPPAWETPRPVLPWLLQVEVTNRCNLNCVFCSRHEHELQLGDLPQGSMTRWLNFLPKPRR